MRRKFLKGFGRSIRLGFDGVAVLFVAVIALAIAGEIWDALKGVRR